MYKITVNNFDLKRICYSGQCFRMKELESNKYAVIAFDSYLEITQNENEIIFSCTEREFNEIWKVYFGFDDDFNILETLVVDDIYMKNAMSYGSGIRILKQDLWEIIVSFIISQQNNIPRIKKSIHMLCEQYGDRKNNHKNQEYFTFPKPDVLINLEESDLKNCNLGYRSKYIIKTAKMICEDTSYLFKLTQLDYVDAKKELMKLYGVGIKVAECICLYALHHLDAFPVDTHILSVVQNHYPNGFPFEKYKGYAGILQQYAFYYDLNMKENEVKSLNIK